VPPGTGWPDEPATPDTPVARTAAAVRRLAATDDLAELEARVSVCSACPRLVRWREDVARDKRASFAAQPYWGRPIAGWGAPTTGPGEARIVIVGLAPAANGGNRTGRVFTGDSSGDWLFASLHRVGLAAQERSEHAGDGQRLLDARMVATVRCAPPQNKPTIAERDTCAPWINRELAVLAPGLRVVVALGAYGWDGALRGLAGAGYVVPRPKPRFGHGSQVVLGHDAGEIRLLGCYHPSQHNTFTGRLTRAMLDEVFATARDLAASDS
jgi:uracil-DNA glycosylase family 4